nr:MAG TPA: hypothetical protein [Caudoviricetes sp.]
MAHFIDQRVSYFSLVIIHAVFKSFTQVLS